MKYALSLVSLLALGLGACGSETYSFTNEGTVCLASRSDGTLDAAVVFPACLSSTCDTVLDTRCEIRAGESDIVMVSYGAYESPKHASCSADCRFLVATCVSPKPVPPGDYDVVHGEDRGTVTLPTSGTTLFSSFAPCDQVLTGDVGAVETEP